MSKYVDLATQAGDKYLEAMAQAQDTYVNAIAQFAKQLPESPVPSVLPPETGPALREAVESSFAFAQKAWDQQKSFVDKLMTAAQI